MTNDYLAGKQLLRRENSWEVDRYFYEFNGKRHYLAHFDLVWITDRDFVAERKVAKDKETGTYDDMGHTYRYETTKYYLSVRLYGHTFKLPLDVFIDKGQVWIDPQRVVLEDAKK